MKKIISVVCIAALLLTALCLTACGGQSLNGTYKLVQMETGGEDFSSLLESIEVYMTIENDHATLQIMGETLEWEIDEKNSVMRNDEGAEAPYRVEDDRIILEATENGFAKTMVFEKVESTPDEKSTSDSK